MVADATRLISVVVKRVSVSDGAKVANATRLISVVVKSVS